MPDFGVEFHDWWAEGVVRGDGDVNGVDACFVGRVGRTWECALQVREVAFDYWSTCDRRL